MHNGFLAEGACTYDTGTRHCPIVSPPLSLVITPLVLPCTETYIWVYFQVMCPKMGTAVLKALTLLEFQAAENCNKEGRVQHHRPHQAPRDVVVWYMWSTCTAGSCEASVRHADTRIASTSFSYLFDAWIHRARRSLVCMNGFRRIKRCASKQKPCTPVNVR